MFALIGNFDFTELLLIAVVALMAFGKNLPQVAMRGAVHLARARRALSDMWREAGLEDELRKVRRDVEREASVPRLQSPRQMAQNAGRRYMDDLRQQVEEEAASGPEDPGSSQPPVLDAAASGSESRPDPYPPRPAAPEVAPTPEPPVQSTPGVDLTPRPVRREPPADQTPLPGEDRREPGWSSSSDDGAREEA